MYLSYNILQVAGKSLYYAYSLLYPLFDVKEMTFFLSDHLRLRLKITGTPPPTFQISFKSKVLMN